MSEDTRSYEELKAEQNALWAESNSKPSPPGYDEHVQNLIEEGMREMEKPGAKFYTQEEVNGIMAEHRAAWPSRDEARAERERILLGGGVSVTEETRTFEEVKAEQDAFWAEQNTKPAPPGYKEWALTQMQEGLDYCNRPDAVFYTQEEAKLIMEAQKLLRRQRERKTA